MEAPTRPLLYVTAVCQHAEQPLRSTRLKFWKNAVICGSKCNIHWPSIYISLIPLLKSVMIYDIVPSASEFRYFYLCLFLNFLFGCSCEWWLFLVVFRKIIMCWIWVKTPLLIKLLGDVLDMETWGPFSWLISIFVPRCSWKRRIFLGWFGDKLGMGIISTILGVFGFGIGISIGLVIGYFLFIYSQPTDVKVCFFFSALLFMFFYDLFLEELCVFRCCFCLLISVYVFFKEGIVLMYVNCDEVSTRKTFNVTLR